MFLQITRVLFKECTKSIRLVRHCSVISNKAENVKTYEVSPRCTLNGFISYKTILMPFDVNNTTGFDKLILRCDKDICVNQIGTSLNLTTSREPLDQNTVCELHVPLKANINLTALGDIKVGDLQGDGIRLFSEAGSVIMGNLKCTDVCVGTNDKDIIVDGNIESTRVDFLCRKKGSIKAQKIKCLGIKLDTNEGDISMNACYSRNGYFITRSGFINLKNVHNRCRIETMGSGKVKMIGFEGALEVALKEGKADLQVQKLLDDSDILVREEGEITLRIPQDLLEHTQIMIWSKGCYVDDELPYTEDELKDLTILRKEGAKIDHTLRVRCMKATCNVHVASWIDMVEKQVLPMKKEDAASIKQQQQTN